MHLALIGAIAVASGLASGGLAENGLQWRLQADVPVRCSVISIDHPADRPQSVIISTTCNAQAYQLVLRPRAAAADLLAAQSSGGAVQITGNAITITSVRPGHAVTTIDLGAPLAAGQLDVAIKPV